MMKSWTDKANTEKSKRNLPGKLAVKTLKLCPLCESLNARSNNVCFVCGWHGTFIQDSRSLHTSLVLLLEQCPDLAEEVALAPRPSFVVRAWTKFATGFHKLFEKLTWSLFPRFRRGRHIDLWI